MSVNFVQRYRILIETNYVSMHHYADHRVVSSVWKINCTKKLAYVQEYNATD